MSLFRSKTSRICIRAGRRRGASAIVKLVGTLLFVDALVHFNADLLIAIDDPQVMPTGEIITLVLSRLVFASLPEKWLFLVVAAAIIGSGNLYNLLNYSSTGFPQWIIGLILALDVVIAIGLARRASVSR